MGRGFRSGLENKLAAGSQVGGKEGRKEIQIKGKDDVGTSSAFPIIAKP